MDEDKSVDQPLQDEGSQEEIIRNDPGSDEIEQKLSDQQPLANHPLSLSWCFGFNPSLTVHNVSDGTRKMMFYVSSHVGVLYDCCSNRQTLLQGHANAITGTAVSGNRRWVVTADVGQDCSLIVWDSYSGVPVCSLFEGLGEGCVTVAMSEDSKYVAGLSTESPQKLTLWDWTSGSESPLCEVSVSSDYGRQTDLVFHPQDPHQLVSNSEDTVVFYQWSGDKLQVHSTPVSDKDFNKSTGVLSQSVFVPGTDQALTVTSEGNAVVWTTKQDDSGLLVKKPEKLMKIHDSAVTVCTTVMGLVVTGDNGGKIKFFDSTLKMVNWYDNPTQFGRLVSISFAHSPQLKLTSKEHRSHLYPNDSTMSAQPFLIPDFTTSSSTASISHTTANGTTTETILDEHDGAIHALSSHPTLPRVAIGGYSSKLKLWDYHKREVLTVRNFKEGSYIQCMAFDPKGETIGVGFSDGSVRLLDSLTLEDLSSPMRYSRDSVTFIAFSNDSTYMATADLDCCVTVYVCGEDSWTFLAKHRSHYKQIQGLIFGVRLDSTLPRLLSLGQDRNVVEYDLVTSSINDLPIMATDRVEQSATPIAFAWYPPLVKESFILVANDQYKLKLFNSTTKMCRQTLLGPAFGSPITRLAVLPSPVKRGPDGEETRRYLAYITTDKVGLLLLPHNGNPHNSSCLVAHPGKVTDMCCSHDGSYVFTSGGDDCTVNMWAINTDALEASSLLGGLELEPFYSMLEGGREGEFFKEFEEYFYYAQIRSQGVDTTTSRDVSSTVPIGQIPDIMRGIGFYPSEEETENMVNEVKFSDYVDSKTIKTDIDLGDLLKLYVNHRPAFGLSPAQFSDAFKVLGQRMGTSQQWTVDRAKLLELLQEKGEHMTEVDLVEYLMTLMGCSDNPEVEGNYTEDPVTALNELPLQLSAPTFAEDLLGLST